MRQTYRLRTWPLLVAVVLTLLAGCAPSSLPNAAPAGIIRWSLEGISDITRLDPARLGSNQENIPIYLIFGGLVRINDRLEIVGEGAERWSVSADGTIYTFNLRRNLKYGDGTQATAQHFAATLARSIAPATGTDFAMTFLEHVVGAHDVRAGKVTSLRGVQALDDYTLVITLDSPRGYFLSQLTYGLTYLVPPGKIEAAGANWLNSAFGTGPFRVKVYEEGKGLLLEGNPFYWAGLPGVQAVQFRFYLTTDAAFSAYLANEVDVMGSVQSGIPTNRLAETKGKPDYQTISAPVMRYIGFSNVLPPFNNVFVRQAFAQALDRSELVPVLGDTVALAERILPQGFPGADQPITPLGFNPVGARAVLGLAGFVSGNDLPPVTLTYDQSDRDLELVAHVLQRNWRETLGIDVYLEPVMLERLNSRLDSMNTSPSDPRNAMQMYLSIWGADYPDPQNFISLQLQSQSPYNNGHWTSAEFDRLVNQADQMSGAQGQRERFGLYREAEQIAVNEVGWLPLYSPQVTLAIRPTVRGLVPTVTPQGILATDWTRVRVVAEAGA